MAGNSGGNGMLSTIIEKIAGSDKSIPLLALNAVEAIFVFIIVKLFGWIAYDRRYLRGRWFERPWSPGWRWAFNGMFSKLFTGHGRGVPWPIGPACDCSPHVSFHPDELNNFQVSAYFQAFDGGRISLGRDVWIARGCALITTNHDPSDPGEHLAPEDIEIGDHCWLGANVVVTPGVVLGPYTTVGANAVVTRSFPEGHCVLAGVPAKKIRDTGCATIRK